jgi:hypothetical protein
VLAVNVRNRTQVLSSQCRPAVSLWLLAALFAALAVVAACNSAQSQECWPTMMKDYYRLTEIQRTDRLQSTEAAKIRDRLTVSVRKCRNEAEEAAPIGGMVADLTGYMTLLDVAVVADDAQSVSELVATGMKAADRRPEMGEHLYGSTSIHMATLFESNKAMQELLRSGTEPGLADLDGYTALHFAGGSTEAGLLNIKLLVETGLDVNAEGKHALRPLDMAVARHDWPAVACLRRLGAVSVRGEDVGSLGSPSDQQSVALANICNQAQE